MYVFIADLVHSALDGKGAQFLIHGQVFLEQPENFNDLTS